MSVKVTGQLISPSPSVLPGISFASLAPLVDPAADTILLPFVRPAVVLSDGSFEIDLLPATYVVRITVGAKVLPALLVVPDDGTIELDIADSLQFDAVPTDPGGGGGEPGDVTWASIIGKPSTFPPSTHAHTYASVTGKPGTFPPDPHGHAYQPVGSYATTTQLADLADATADDLAELTQVVAGKQPAGSYATTAALTAVSDRVTDLEEAPGGGGGSSLVVRRGVVTSGNLTLAVAGAWVPVAGGPSMVLPAAIGDYVEFSLPSMLGNFTVNFADLAVLAGGNLVRFLSTGGSAGATEGAPAFYGDQSFDRTSPVFEFVAEAGDIEGGNVTVVFATKGSGGGTIYASTDYPLRWRAMNYGPASVA